MIFDGVFWLDENANSQNLMNRKNTPNCFFDIQSTKPDGL